METFDLKSVRIFDGQGKPTSLDEMILTLKQKLPTDLKGKIYVGTDTHVHGDKYAFLSTLCLWGEGTGGHFYKFRTMVPRKRFRSMHERLLAEAQRSLDVAYALMTLEPFFTNKEFVIHLDVNTPTSNHPSGQSAESLRSYVRAMDFECEIKPQSWAANAIADKYAR